MMTFSQVCMGIVITLGVSVGMFLFGTFLSWLAKDDVEGSLFYSFLFSSIGFGICLTIVLVQNGIIK